MAETTGDVWERLRCNRVIRSTGDVWDFGCWSLLFGDSGGLNSGSPHDYRSGAFGSRMVSVDNGPGLGIWNSIDRNFRVCLTHFVAAQTALSIRLTGVFHSDKCCVLPATKFTHRACIWPAPIPSPSPAPNNQQPSRSVHTPASPAPVRVQILDRSAIVKGGLLGASLKAGKPRISQTAITSPHVSLFTPQDTSTSAVLDAG